MPDLVSEVDAVAFAHELHHGLGAVVRRQVEVAWHLVQLHVAFELAALISCELFLGLLINNVLIALLILLCDCVSDANDFSVRVERVLVEAAFNAHQVHSGHIDDV